MRESVFHIQIVVKIALNARKLSTMNVRARFVETAINS